MKIKNRSRKWSHKRDGIGVRRIRTLPFLPTLLTTPSLTLCLRSSENQIVGVGSRSGRINQSQCTFPRFVIGLVLLLLLPTLTIWFSPDHTRNVSDGIISGIRTLFSLDHKLYAADYDSDSDCDCVASENQQEGILYAHASIWAVEVPQRHFLRIVYVQYQHLTCIGCYVPQTCSLWYRGISTMKVSLLYPRCRP